MCYQVVTRTTWQLVAVSDSQLKSTSSQIAAAAVAPSRATSRCPAPTALYRPDPHQRVSRERVAEMVVKEVEEEEMIQMISGVELP